MLEVKIIILVTCFLASLADGYSEHIYYLSRRASGFAVSKKKDVARKLSDAIEFLFIPSAFSILALYLNAFTYLQALISIVAAAGIRWFFRDGIYNILNGVYGWFGVGTVSRTDLLATWLNVPVWLQKTVFLITSLLAFLLI